MISRLLKFQVVETIQHCNLNDFSREKFYNNIVDIKKTICYY